MIKFSCPMCKEKYEMADAAVGRKAICDSCGVEFTIKPAEYVPERKPSHWITISIIAILFGSILAGYSIITFKRLEPAKPAPVETPLQDEVIDEEMLAELERAITPPSPAPSPTNNTPSAPHPAPVWRKSPHIYDKLHANRQTEVNKYYSDLTKGLETIDFGALAMSQLCLSGEKAFPVAFSRADDIACAAGLIDKGRIVVIGNSDAADIKPDNSPSSRFILNAITWADNAKATSLASNRKYAGLFEILSSSGIPAVVAEPSDLDTSKYSVYICSGTDKLSPKDCARLLEFTAKGGGLIICDSSRGLNGQPISASPFSRIAGQAGIYFTGWFTGSVYEKQESTSLLYNLEWALRAIDNDLPLSIKDQRIACDAIQLATRFFTRHSLYHDVMNRVSRSKGWVQVSKTSPLAVAERPLDAMLARYQSEQILKRSSPLSTPAHPSSSDWPGPAAVARNISEKKVRINGNTPGEPAKEIIDISDYTLRMTGVYAPPGACLTVNIPRHLSSAGLKLRIGIHNSINYNKPTWTRYPDVVTEHALSGPTVKAANSFGGLVCVMVPPGSEFGEFEISITGGINTPYFREGRITQEDWLIFGRNLPGPWGFLENDNVILAASSADLRQIEDPDAVLYQWDQVIRLMDELSGAQKARQRPHLIVIDRQITRSETGYGYPVMIQAPDAISLLNTLPDVKDRWNTYMEVARSYLEDTCPEGTITGDPEIDASWFAAYVFEKVHDMPKWDMTDWPDWRIEPSRRISAVNKLMSKPAGEMTWQAACSMPPAAYDVFWQIKDAFGWDLFIKVNRRINSILADDIARLSARDKWLILACHESGRNLLPFLRSRGIKDIPDFAVRSVKGFPEWTGNSAPAPVQNAKRRIREDEPRGTLVHRIDSADPDPGNILRYVITGGNQNDAFVMDRTTGEIRVNNIDYEVSASHLLEVMVADSAVPSISQKATVSISIENIEEPPKVRNQAFIMQDKEKFGALIGRINAIPESGRKMMFEIEKQAMPNAFAINFESGDIFKGDGRFEPGDVYKMLIKVSDQASDKACSTSTATIFCGLRNGVTCEYWLGSKTPDFKSVSSAAAKAIPPTKKDKRIAIDKAVIEKGPLLCKVSGWLIPPEDGEYTFWLSSGAPAQLALANGPKPIDTLKICECLTPNKPGDFDSNGSQKSGEVRLKAGVCYYFEVSFKSAGDNSHLAVAWKVPGKPRKVVPSESITPELP